MQFLESNFKDAFESTTGWFDAGFALYYYEKGLGKYGISYDSEGTWLTVNYNLTLNPNKNKLASEEDIVKALSKVAMKKGYREGTTIEKFNSPGHVTLKRQTTTLMSYDESINAFRMFGEIIMKDGKWVDIVIEDGWYMNDQYPKRMVYVDDQYLKYGFGREGNWTKLNPLATVSKDDYKVSNIIVLSRLSDEAIRKGYKEYIKIKDLITGEPVTITRASLIAFKIYNNTAPRLTLYDRTIFYDGNWAKILPNKTGIELVTEECNRQINEEGYNLNHDKKYTNNELSYAGIHYALPEDTRKFLNRSGIDLWPWDDVHYKPTTRLRDLVKAASLIIADIDRIQNSEE